MNEFEENEWENNLIEGNMNMSLVDWPFISKYRHLSEYTMRQYKDKIDWVNASIFQKMSEQFIWEMKGYVYWPAILTHQKLSQKFRDEVKTFLLYQEIKKEVLPEKQEKQNEFQFLEIEK